MTPRRSTRTPRRHDAGRRAEEAIRPRTSRRATGGAAVRFLERRADLMAAHVLAHVGVLNLYGAGDRGGVTAAIDTLAGGDALERIMRDLTPILAERSIDEWPICQVIGRELDAREMAAYLLGIAVGRQLRERPLPAYTSRVDEV